MFHLNDLRICILASQKVSVKLIPILVFAEKICVSYRRVFFSPIASVERGDDQGFKKMNTFEYLII